MTNASPPPLAHAAAPAKVILLGEHAVVYGHPALAAPITAVGVEATVWPGDGAGLSIASRWPDGWTDVDVALAGDGVPMAAAVRATFARLNVEDLPSWRITVQSTIPPGRGMGSSAAVAVALVRAVAAAAGIVLDDAAVSELAMESERIVHGRPSGIDNACVAIGRPIWFEAGAIRRAPVGRTLGLVVADSGRFSSTRAMVEAVRAARTADPAGIDAVLSALGDLTVRGAAALAVGDGAALGRAMTAAHDSLRRLGVSTPDLDRLAEAAARAGAFGAKLAGSGGGGVIVAVCPPQDAARIAAACRAAGAPWTCEARLEADGPAATLGGG
ncbi:MAG: mevalonate kinase [Ardenticatenales bacterium]|nr:mevalonate kinase [Ardenticatenales bacterium]